MACSVAGALSHLAGMATLWSPAFRRPGPVQGAHRRRHGRRRRADLAADPEATGVAFPPRPGARQPGARPVQRLAGDDRSLAHPRDRPGAAALRTGAVALQHHRVHPGHRPALHLDPQPPLRPERSGDARAQGGGAYAVRRGRRVAGAEAPGARHRPVGQRHRGGPHRERRPALPRHDGEPDRRSARRDRRHPLHRGGRDREAAVRGAAGVDGGAARHRLPALRAGAGELGHHRLRAGRRAALHLYLQPAAGHRPGGLHRPHRRRGLPRGRAAADRAAEAAGAGERRPREPGARGRDRRRDAVLRPAARGQDRRGRQGRGGDRHRAGL